METVMGDDKKVKKVGLKDQQREGWEYELTVSLTIDRDTHKAIASKDRTNIFEGQMPFLITEQTGQEIAKWCNSGEAEKSAAERMQEATTLAELANIYNSLTADEKKQVTELKDTLKQQLS